ncbi:MAG TPA: hypothetical protein VE983_10740, partial [Solirubrobacteraceae bacterium]|nr:hypothetical protein [Solirubrobacteraceae bacterium]
ELGDVFAAGDMTTFPIKQGGLATQQADHIAHGLAARFGLPVRELRPSLVLQAVLMGGREPILLRTELDWRGQPTPASLEHIHHSGPGAPTKVFGRYLTPYLEAVESAAA